jgi:glycosyltransferase involved in cell wall biosynthesis
VALEAQASGTPVIAYDAGGARDTVVGGITGIRFAPQTAAALESAIREAATRSWDHELISRYAAGFEQSPFKTRFEALVGGLHQRQQQAGHALVVESGDAF